MQELTLRRLAVFRAKALAHQVVRLIRDKLTRVRSLAKTPEGLTFLSAQLRSPLWTNEQSVEAAMQFGKIQNLRTAVAKLDSVLIPAGEIFSFWKQIGPSFACRGFVPGRELKQGCIVPSIGGGLCQLSNALYDLALQLRCDIVERHAHSQVIPGSAAAQGRDATVFWNYIDLRFRPTTNIWLRAYLTSDDLILKAFSQDPVATIKRTEAIWPGIFEAHKPNNCFDCGQVSCSLHAPALMLRAEEREIALLDERFPEFQQFLREHAPKALIYSTKSGSSSVRLQAFIRSASMRAARTPAAKRKAHLLGSARITRALAQHTPYQTRHWIVAQAYLPELWRSGWLGGRTFDVLMTRLPFAELHCALDEAAKVHPNDPTLRDFRAPLRTVQDEADALNSARKVITTHTGIAKLFGERAHLLNFEVPHAHTRQQSVPSKAVLFPGPNLARKGMYEVAKALSGTGLRLHLLDARHNLDLFDGISVIAAPLDWSRIGVVLQPSFVEDSPRLLATALKQGIPVIATDASGLPEHPLLQIVPRGNVISIKEALSRIQSSAMLELNEYPLGPE